MKRLLLLSGAVFAMLGAQAQFTGFSVELVQEHDGSIAGLEGHSTYRVYADFTSPDDVVSAFFGDAATPLTLTSETGFWQSPAGGDFATSINAGLFGVLPDLEYDSWLTIGAENSSEAESGISQVGMSAALGEFNAGGNFELNTPNGGSWFVTFGNTNAIAGDDNKVLVAQLTTDSGFSGSFNIQAFNGGDQSAEEITEASCFSTDGSAIFGCTDPAATNYVEGATDQCGACTYPCALEVVVTSNAGTSCFGDNDATVSLSQTGAQLGILYSHPTLDTTPYLANASYINLSAGEYTVYAVDGAGCEAEIMFEVVEPAPVEVSASVSDPISCNGEADGVISGEATGGTGGYTFSLSSNFDNPMSDLMFDGLGAGLYTVYAQDDNGCQAATNPMNLNNPMALSVGVTASSPASCFNSEDGQIVVQPIGGTGTAASMTYGIDGENFSSGNILSVGGGTYTIYVMDVNGCIGQSNNTVTIDAPDVIEVDVVTQAILCAGDENGVVDVNASGGSGSFSYIFGGDTTDMMMFDGLAPGDYVVTVLDSDGCSLSTDAMVGDASPVVVNISVANVSCNGEGDGEMSINATGGTDVFEYSLDNVVFGVSPEFTNLDPSVYNVYVMDSNGCVANDQVTLTEPDPLSLTGTASNETSDGAGDGAIDVDVAGGNGGYEFSWSGPDGYSSLEEDIAYLSAGDYTLTVTDANGCEISEVFGVAVGIAEFTGDEAFVAFPNPSTGLFIIDWISESSTRWEWSVVDMQGRVVKNGQWNGIGQGQSLVLDLSDQANGAYTLQANNSRDKAILRLLIQR